MDTRVNFPDGLFLNTPLARRRKRAVFGILCRGSVRLYYRLNTRRRLAEKITPITIDKHLCLVRLGKCLRLFS